MRNFAELISVMKKNEILFLPLFKTYFPNSKRIRRSELRDFYRDQDAELTDQAFRRKLYSLEKKKIIQHIGWGLYSLDDTKLKETQLEDAQPISRPRKRYIPVKSPEIRALGTLLLTDFPYTAYQVWETKILHEFMLHQPGQSQIILEVEKEAAESVFNFLVSRYPGKAFLEPKQSILERYILNNPGSIIVSHLISRSPMQKVDGIPCPKIEKILVDIFADEEKFLAFHGQELVHIYENVFQTYLVSEKTLFSYAKRRKVHERIRTFIDQSTSIQLESR